MVKNIFKGLLIGLLVLLAMSLFSTPAIAFDARSGETVTVSSGEVVEGDLYVAARYIVIDGRVNGDIFGAGLVLTINGTVNGGVTLPAGR